MGIVSTIQLVLNDSGVFWPETQIIESINEAQLWVTAQTKWKRQSWPISLPTGTDLFSVPSDLLIPGWIESAVPVINGTSTTTTYKRAFPTTHVELEKYNRLWRNAEVYAPQYFVIWDASTLRAFPRPDISYTYTLYGVPYPIEITTSTQSLEGPHGYQHSVEKYTLALLLEATRPELADFYMEDAENEILQLRKTLRNQQSHNIRRLRPASVMGMGNKSNYSTLTPPGRFDLQQGGSIQAIPVYYPVEA